MGMVFHRDGKPYVLRAIATVRFTPLQQWIARGERSHYVVKRLKSAGKDLGVAGVEKLRTAARRFEGRPYDLAFDWSDEKIYCSELVWKAYDRALGIEDRNAGEGKGLQSHRPRRAREAARALRNEDSARRTRHLSGFDVPLTAPDYRG